MGLNEPFMYSQLCCSYILCHFNIEQNDVMFHMTTSTFLFLFFSKENCVSQLHHTKRGSLVFWQYTWRHSHSQLQPWFPPYWNRGQGVRHGWIMVWSFTSLRTE